MKRIGMMLVVLALISSLSLTFVGQAFAYTYIGGKWLYKTIYWYDGTGMALTVSAADSWTTATEISLVKNLSTVFIYAKANRSDVAWDGLTEVTRNVLGNFTSCKCQVNAYYTGSYTSHQTQGVLAHEFGHSLGLGHQTSLAIMSVMYPYTSGRAYWLPKPDDISGVNNLY